MYATYSYYLYSLISDKKRMGCSYKVILQKSVVKDLDFGAIIFSLLFVFVQSTGHQKGVQYFICSLELFVFS